MKIFLTIVFVLFSMASVCSALQIQPLDACKIMDDTMTVKGKTWRIDEIGGLCSTPYEDIQGETATKSNIAFYASGEASAATRLKLVLNVNDPSSEVNAVGKFTQYAGALYAKLMKKPWDKKLSTEFSESISKGTGKEWKEGGVSFRVFKKVWPTGKGYELQFVVE